MKILATLTFLFCSLAWSYIPSTQFIFDRMTDNHGKGSYAIETEVTFTDGVEKFIVKEGWIINDNNDMRVLAWGDNFKIFRVLKGGRISWIDAENRLRTDEIADHFMTPLMLKDQLEAKRFFIRWNVLPPEVLKDKKPLPKEIKDIKYEPEPWVRLGRVSGAVTYAYGKPSPPDGLPSPGLWVEQDSFVIRKMRSPSGAEFVGNNYGAYSKGLWFPRTQTITFHNVAVAVRVTRIAAIELNGDQRRQLDPSTLRSRPDAAAIWPKSPLAPVLQEFYKRFR